MSDLSTTAPLMGVVLAGGRSKRMGQDKASLAWDGAPLWRHQFDLLNETGLPVAISVRAGQELASDHTEGYTLIPDQDEDAGPLSGFMSAWLKYPNHALLVVACDLPLLDLITLKTLITQRNPLKWATVFNSANDGLPEPLCAIYEPAARSQMEAAVSSGRRCPRKILINSGDGVQLLTLPVATALENANTPEEFARLQALRLEAEA